MVYFNISCLPLGRSTHVINVSNIILTCYEQRDKRNKIVNEIELFPSQYFSVHFAKKSKHHKWKYQCIHFHAADSEQCQAWVDGIQNLLMGEKLILCLFKFTLSFWLFSIYSTPVIDIIKDPTNWILIFSTFWVKLRCVTSTMLAGKKSILHRCRHSCFLNRTIKTKIIVFHSPTNIFTIFLS